MNDDTDTIDDRRAETRQSFTGRGLTESQFDEAWALAGIMAREIRKSGTFREKLSDYAHAFARTERFDALRGEEIIRDIFKARYGETMNQMRERMVNREHEIETAIGEDALRRAQSIPDLIREAPTMPFYRAYDQAAVAMAAEHGITEAGAKQMMKAAFASYAHEGRDLYEAGKEAEKLYHKPVREEASRSQGKPFSRSRRQRSCD
jgi:hypothetical protein